MGKRGPGDRLNQSATGEQALLRLDAASISTTSKLGKTLLDLGAIGDAGTYYCDVDVTGCADAEVIVRASAGSGTVTPSAYTTNIDGSTSKTALTDSGAGALAAATRRTFSISGLKGVRNIRFQFIVSAASSVTFDQAEFNCL
jgi:hypothetical protein